METVNNLFVELLKEVYVRASFLSYYEENNNNEREKNERDKYTHKYN